MVFRWKSYNGVYCLTSSLPSVTCITLCLTCPFSVLENFGICQLYGCSRCLLSFRFIHLGTTIPYSFLNDSFHVTFKTANYHFLFTFRYTDNSVSRENHSETEGSCAGPSKTVGTLQGQNWEQRGWQNNPFDWISK